MTGIRLFLQKQYCYSLDYFRNSVSTGQPKNYGWEVNKGTRWMSNGWPPFPTKVPTFEGILSHFMTKHQSPPY